MLDFQSSGFVSTLYFLSGKGEECLKFGMNLPPVFSSWQKNELVLQYIGLRVGDFNGCFSLWNQFG